MLTSASVYDLEQAGNTEDITFFRDAVLQLGGPVLELGCGTGRLTIPVAEGGIEVVGLDISIDMLSRFRDKMQSLSENIKNNIAMVRGDIGRFTLKKIFQTIICSSNTLFLLESEAAIADALNCMRSHLLPSGEFIIDVDAISAETRLALASYPHEDVADIAVMGKSGDEPLQRTHSIEVLGPSVANSETSLSRKRFRVSYKYRDPSGVICATRREDVLLLTPDELSRLICEQGFEITEQFGWYDRRPFTPADNKLLIIARKKE